MSLLPTATYGGATEPLYAPAGSVKTAEGPAGAVQYTDGAGNFLGNDGLVYDGIAKLENTPSGNSLDLNTAGGVVLTANTLALDIAGTPGTAGYVLTSDGDVASWQPSGGGGGVPNTWALYPATNNVNIANFNITNCNSLVTTTIQGPGVAPGVVTSVSDLDMSGNNIINLSVMSGIVAGPGQPKTTSLDSTVLIDVAGVQGVADINNIRKIDTNLSVLENLRGLKGAINPTTGAPTFGFNDSIVDEIAGIRGRPNFAGVPVIDAFQSRFTNLRGIQGVLNPATGINALEVGDTILDGVAGIIGVPLAPGQLPLIDMGTSKLINVSEIGGAPTAGAPPTLFVTTDMDLNQNNIVGCQSISASTVNTADIVLNSPLGGPPASITLGANGVVLKNGFPVVYTGLTGPAQQDVGFTSFAILVPGVSALSIVIATIQVPDQPGDEATWLVNCVPSNTANPAVGRLTFNFAAQITQGSQLKVAWIVTQL